MKFADSHAHMLDERLKDKAEIIIKNMQADGLAFIVEVGCEPDDAKEALSFANRHDNIYCAVGVHPHYASAYSDDFDEWLRGLAGKEASKKIIALGECGLDYHYDHSPRNVQREVFIRQIKLAHELGLPLVVHSRDSFEDIHKILLENKELLTNGLIMHCFSYGVEEVKKLLELDCYFSFSGALTYHKTYDNLQIAYDVVRAVPFNRLMAETDCPYLAPVPLRGTINEPKNVKYVIEHMATALGKSFDEVCEVTLENTKRVFRI